MGSTDTASDALEATLSSFEGAAGAPLTTSEVAEDQGCSRRTAYNRLERLVERNALETKKVGARGRVWWRPVDATAPPADAEATRLDQQTRRLERQRDELRRELDGVLERVSDGFVALDAMFRFTYVNERAETLLSTSREQLLETFIWDAIDPIPSAEAALEEAFQAQSSVGFEAYDDSHDAWFEYTVYPSETGLSIHFRDVTDRKERNVELERYETIVETVADGVFALDPDDRFTMVNDAFCEMSGCDRETLLGAPFERVVEETSAVSVGTLADESGSVEFELTTAGDEGEPVECRFGPYRYDRDRCARTGVVRSIREQKRFEETLTALYDASRELLAAETDEDVSSTTVATATRVLDLGGITVYLAGGDEAVLYPTAQSFASPAAGRAVAPIPVGDAGSIGRAYAQGETVVGVDETADTVTDADLVVPLGDHGVVAVTNDEATGRTRQLVELLAATAESAFDQVERDGQLERQRRHLAILDEINGVIREINEAIVQQSTREEIEETVCERLAAADSYSFAHVCEVDPKAETVTPRVEAGVEGYLEEVSLSTDPDEATARGPLGRAIRTFEPQVCRNAESDPGFEPWRDLAEQYGYDAAAAIPIVHQETLYGVLCVYTDRPDAFAASERSLVGQVGEIVGHAITAVDRKQALMSDDLVEVEFKVRDVADAFGLETASTGPVTLDSTIAVGDGVHLGYGTVTASGVPLLEELIEQIDHWESVAYLGEETGERRFEIRFSEPPVLSAVASAGGSVERARLIDGDYDVTIRLPPAVDVRTVIRTIQETYPTAEMVTRRQVGRERPTLDGDEDPIAVLTDRQRTALEVAVHAGFFEWPRKTSGQDVAATLDVSAPTFHQHVRRAEQQLFDLLVGDA